MYTHKKNYNHIAHSFVLVNWAVFIWYLLIHEFHTSNLLLLDSPFWIINLVIIDCFIVHRRSLKLELGRKLRTEGLKIDIESLEWGGVLGVGEDSPPYQARGLGVKSLKSDHSGGGELEQIWGQPWRHREARPPHFNRQASPKARASSEKFAES